MRLLLQELYLKWLADPGFIEKVFYDIPPSSKLRRLIVASFLFVSMDDSYALLRPTLPAETDGLQDFAIEVMKEVSEEGRAVGRIPSSNPARFLLRPTSKDI